MNPVFIARFEAHKAALEAQFARDHPSDYAAIVKAVIAAITAEGDRPTPDPNRIHCIDDGDYQGTLLFVIGATGYQPYDYWYVKVAYGTCSGCDTLEAIRAYSDEPPTPEQVRDYMMLALHIVQGLKKTAGYGEGEDTP